MKIERTGIIIKPDPARVLYRPFLLSEERIVKVLARVMTLSEEEVASKVDRVMNEFSGRHYQLESFFYQQFEQVKAQIFTDIPLTNTRKLLIGSYFTQEYSLESAALFNPSMIWHPNQSDLPEGSRRFIVSLRSTGEGHLSSITFRSGVISADHKIRLNEPTRFVTAPQIIPDARFEKALFREKLFELDLASEFTDQILEGLSDYFSFSDLDSRINHVLRQRSNRDGQIQGIAHGIYSLAKSNYEVTYNSDGRLSERVIFPTSPAELNGIEDARFVEFRDEEDQRVYYATYTAYDGRVMFPQLLETRDFINFKISTLNGPAVSNKGMALFPRKVNGHYAMLSRQDNENIYLMYSDMLHFWYTKEVVLRPTYDWEYVQLGNCGSPIETEAGWLVITHGVGPMRKYAMGAILLDLNDPLKVIGRLKRPLLAPNKNEREGYVPNVVYSCGSQLFNGKLIVPYAMSDYASSFALVNLDELLEELTH